MASEQLYLVGYDERTRRRDISVVVRGFMSLNMHNQPSPWIIFSPDKPGVKIGQKLSTAFERQGIEHSASVAPELQSRSYDVIGPQSPSFWLQIHEGVKTRERREAKAKLDALAQSTVIGIMPMDHFDACASINPIERTSFGSVTVSHQHYLQLDPTVTNLPARLGEQTTPNLNLQGVWPQEPHRLLKQQEIHCRPHASLYETDCTV